MAQFHPVPEARAQGTKRVTIYYATGATKARIVLDAAQEIQWNYEATTVGDMQSIYEQDAELIARMILGHLPAGTVDVLRGILLDKNRCRVVQHEANTSKGAPLRIRGGEVESEESIESVEFEESNESGV